MHSRAYFAWRLVAEAEEERRYERRQDLIRRRDLSPTSCISDTHFEQKYRLTKSAFKYLCQELKENGNLKRSQRVSLEIKVLSALLFYANGGYQRAVGIANNLSQESISSYVKQVTEALNHPNIVKKFIKFPDTVEAREQLKQNFYNLYGIPGVVGCVDGCHFRIVKPHRDEQHLYYYRNNYYSLNVQMVVDHNGKIMSINPKFGGASHNAFVWENSKISTFMQNLNQNGECVWLLGDSEYHLRPWLLTPYTNPAPGSAEETFNKFHNKTRIILENTIGKLQNRWRCVRKDKALHYIPVKCAKIITACSVLHNIALDFGVPAPKERLHVNEDESIDLNETEDLPEDEDPSMQTLGRLVRDRVARKLHDPT